ncbi:hypothetical protein AFEL58S_01985 [Afipia felis]
MMVDVQIIVPWLALATGIASFVYAMRRDKSQAVDQKLADLGTFADTRASKEHVASIADKLDRLEDRATRIESELSHLPDTKTVGSIELKMAELSSQVGILAERIRPVAAIADRLQEKILESSGV